MTEEELIAVIREKPGLYLGRETVTGLAHFLDGYFFGRSEKRDSQLTSEFQQFVCERFGISTSHRWHKIILFMEEDEVSAFRAFYVLWDEFKESRLSVTPKFRKEKKRKKIKPKETISGEICGYVRFCECLAAGAKPKTGGGDRGYVKIL